MEPVRWWGYQHVDGSLHVKRYFDRSDICEAFASDFVKYVCGPFPANSREEALEKLKGGLSHGSV